MHLKSKMRTDAPKFEWAVFDGDLVNNATSIIASEQIGEDHCFDRTGCNCPPWLIPGQRSGCGIYDVMISRNERTKDHVIFRGENDE